MAATAAYRGLGWALHNPSLMSREELISRFLLRQPLLDELVRQIRLQPDGAGLRHLLCIGQRGMGKTTLLLRLQYFIEDDPELGPLWQPVLLAEEQYQIGDLADLFLEVLRQLAAEVAGEGRLAEKADALLARGLPASELTAQALAELGRFCARSRRRLVLLVDNINMILAQLSDEEAHRLRRILMTDGNILVVGAAATYFAEVTDYDQPFYEFFRPLRLEGLSEEELEQFLRALAEHNDDQAVLVALRQYPERVRNLRRLTGGNPRIALFLYRLISETPDGEIRHDLERLLDEVTPFYKHRMEMLSPQLRRIFDAIARHWHPVEAGELGLRLRMKSNAISAQIGRLINDGYVEEAGGNGKQKRYQVAERMYNIYYLMRFSRSGRQKLQWLVLFLRAFYEQEHLHALPDSWIQRWRSESAVGPPQERVRSLGYIAQAIDDDAQRASLIREKIIPYGQSQGLPGDEMKRLIDEILASVSARSTLGMTHLAMRRPDLAALEFERLVSAAPSSGMVRQNLGMAYLALGRHQEGLEQVEKAVVVEPGLWPLWINLANLYKAFHQPERARTTLERATQTLPQETNIWSYLGQLYLQLGLLEEARAVFKRLIELAPMQAAIWHNNLGAIALQHGRTAEAREELEHTLQLDPCVAGAWQNLFYTYLLDGEEYKAQEALKQLMAIQPQLEGVALWIAAGRLAEQHQRYPQALAIAELATKRHPTSPGLWSMRAWMEFLLQIDIVDAGEASLGNALAMTPNEPTLLVLQALIHLKMQDGAAMALHAVTSALSHTSPTAVEQILDYLLRAVVELVARGYEKEIAELIDQHQDLQLADRWLPLRAALDVLSGADPERLLKLAPEVRQTAEDLLVAVRARRDISHPRAATPQ